MSFLEEYRLCSDVSIHFFIRSHYHGCLSASADHFCSITQKPRLSERHLRVSVPLPITCRNPALRLSSDGLLVKCTRGLTHILWFSAFHLTWTSFYTKRETFINDVCLMCRPIMCLKFHHTNMTPSTPSAVPAECEGHVNNSLEQGSVKPQGWVF